MPLPYLHLGTGLFFGTTLAKRINLAAFLIGAVFPDIEPGILVIYNWQYPPSSYPHHWLMHSFLAGFLFAILAAILLTNYGKKLEEVEKQIIHKSLFFRQKSFKVIFLSGLLGYWLHVFLDGVMHYDVSPFWPLKTNQLLRIISFSNENLILAIIGIIGLFLFIFQLIRKDSNKSI
ncbi:MAG: DUF4184 family protein [bacterium]